MRSRDHRGSGAFRIPHSALRTHLIVGVLLLGAPVRPACAQEAEIPREHHAWARFAPGSWKLVRIVTENFDSAGRLAAASVTHTRTTLKEAGAAGFTLQIESTVELEGKRIDSPLQQVAQQYNGALVGQTAQARVLGSDAVTIDGKSYPCRIYHYEITGNGQKSMTRTHYSSEVAPHVLRRETTALETASNSTISHVLVEVKELNVPHNTCGQLHSAARMRVEQKHAKGKETTDALSSLRVPGGVIWHDSTLLDTAGNKLSQSKLELVDYHVVQRNPPPRDARAAGPLPFLSFRDDPRPASCHEVRGGLFAQCRAWARGH